MTTSQARRWAADRGTNIQKGIFLNSMLDTGAPKLGTTMGRELPSRKATKMLSPTKIAVAVSLALGVVSAAHAVRLPADFVINAGNSLTSGLTLINGDTLTVQSDGSIVEPSNACCSASGVTVNGGATVVSLLSNAGNIAATGSSGYGIINNGTINTLTNSGRVSGGQGGDGIDNWGTINTLTNSGTISGGTTWGLGIANGGTINSLINTGTISGGTSSSVGIDNWGTINTLINTGTISGTWMDIYNWWGTIGTLINGQSTPLLFDGNAPNAYYTYFSTPSNYGKISFQSLNSYTLSTYGLRIAPGQNYQTGTYTNVIVSNRALTITSQEAVSGVTYHLVDVGSVGTTWNLVIDSVSANRVGAAARAVGNSVVGNAGNVIDNNPGLSALFAPLTTNSQLSSGASTTLPVLVGGSMLAAQNILTNINNIIRARQEGNLGLSSGDDFYGDRHFWLKPFGSRADQGARSGVDGFKADTYGVAVGVDGTVGQNWRIGGAFAYANSNVNSKSSVTPQNDKVDVYQLIGYGSYALDDRTAIKLQADAGQNTNRERRQVFTGDTAAGNYDSLSTHLGVGIERSYAFSSQTNLIPSLGLDYTWMRDSAYSETGAGLLNLSVNSRSTESLVLTVGGKVTHQLNEQITLLANLGVGYDTLNQQATITATYAGAPGSAFITDGIKPDPWLARAGLGAVFKLKNGPELTARYDAESRSSFLNQSASIKARWAF